VQDGGSIPFVQKRADAQRQLEFHPGRLAGRPAGQPGDQQVSTQQVQGARVTLGARRARSPVEARPGRHAVLDRQERGQPRHRVGRRPQADPPVVGSFRDPIHIGLRVELLCVEAGSFTA
jgi:hypothetical protein